MDSKDKIIHTSSGNFKSMPKENVREIESTNNAWILYYETLRTQYTAFVNECRNVFLGRNHTFDLNESQFPKGSEFKSYRPEISNSSLLALACSRIQNRFNHLKHRYEIFQSESDTFNLERYNNPEDRDYYGRISPLKIFEITMIRESESDVYRIQEYNTNTYQSWRGLYDILISRHPYLESNMYCNKIYKKYITKYILGGDVFTLYMDSGDKNDSRKNCIVYDVSASNGDDDNDRKKVKSMIEIMKPKLMHCTILPLPPGDDDHSHLFDIVTESDGKHVWKLNNTSKVRE